MNIGSLLAGLAGGATGLSRSLQAIDETHQQDEDRKLARQDRLATMAMQQAAHQATQEKGMREDALKGLRNGMAPNGQAINNAMDVAAQASGGLAMPGLAAMRAADPGKFSPERFQQVTPTSYVDNTATPEAIATRRASEAEDAAGRRATAADQMKRANEAGDRARKIMAMKGTTLPNGQVVDERLANVLLESPTMGAAFVKPAEKEPQDHFAGSNVVDPATGRPYILNTRTGEQTLGLGARPATQGQGAEQKKEEKRLSLMDQGFSMMKDYHGKIRPTAIATAIASPTAGNLLLNEDEQNYLLGLNNFVTGETHSESGARLSTVILKNAFHRFGPQVGDKGDMGNTRLREASKTLEAQRAAFGKHGPVVPEHSADNPYAVQK